MLMLTELKREEGNKYSRFQITKSQRKGFLWTQTNKQQTKITKWWHKPDTKRYNTEKSQIYKKMAELNPKLW